MTKHNSAYRAKRKPLDDDYDAKREPLDDDYVAKLKAFKKKGSK
jgi:hypothetical protein